jgi:hypothetical protein
LDGEGMSKIAKNTHNDMAICFSAQSTYASDLGREAGYVTLSAIQKIALGRTAKDDYGAARHGTLRAR